MRILAFAAFVLSSGVAAQNAVVRNSGQSARGAPTQSQIRAADFGAVCNFNPLTGAGNDDRAAIQKALNHAAALPGTTVTLPGGNCYLGAGYQIALPGLRAQLVIGSKSVPHAAKNLRLDGSGATIYAGAPGTALFVGNVDGAELRNLRMVGFAGGPLGPGREFDFLVAISQRSTGITIRGGYFTNALGWLIAIQGDPTIAGGGSTSTPSDIRILEGTFKQRQGNGLTSASGGTKTQNAIQATDVDGLVIRGNTIYGRVDLEPNKLPDGTHQHMLGIDVAGNTFKSGWVTPYAAAPVPHGQEWLDEPLGRPGQGSQIEQALALQGLDVAPIVRAVSFRGNTFERGMIYVQGMDAGTSSYVASVLENKFQAGQILIGHHVAGAKNFNAGFVVRGNTAQTAHSRQGFILLDGAVSASEFSGNTLLADDAPVIGLSGDGASDAGNNKFQNNRSIRARK